MLPIIRTRDLVENVLLRLPELAPHYPIQLDRDGPMDMITVLTEATEEWCSGIGGWNEDHSSVAQLCGQARATLEQTLGISTGVRLQAPRSIPRSEGKAVRILDRRKG